METLWQIALMSAAGYGTYLMILTSRSLSKADRWRFILTVPLIVLLVEDLREGIPQRTEESREKALQIRQVEHGWDSSKGGFAELDWSDGGLVI